MSDFAPRIITIKINPEKIREIIGKGGSMIRKIQEETSTEINVEDDGTVEIAAVSGENARKAIQWIESLTREVEIGALYLGKVTRIMGFGAFVEILPGKEGLVRIGELADYHVPDRRGRRVRRRRGHGRRHRGRPPGPGQPLAQGRDAAPPGQGPGVRARAAGLAIAEPPHSRTPGGARRRARRRGRCYTPAVPVRLRPSSGAMPRMNRSTPHRRRRRRHRRRRSDDDPGPPRAGVPDRGAAPARLGPIGRADRLGRRAARSRSARPSPRPSTASTSPSSRPAPTSRASSRPAAVARGATVIDNSSRLADGPDRPARRQPGQPGRPRGPPGDHRQPELLHDAARAGPHGPARRGRASSGSSSTPTSPSRAPAPTRIAELEGQIRAHVAGRAEDRRASTRTRSPSTPSPRSTSSSPTATRRRSGRSSAENRKILHLPDLRISCTAVRIPVFVSHSEAVHVETRDPITPGAGPRAVRRGARASSSRTTRPRTSTRWRPRPPAATRSSSAASAATSRSPDGRGLAFWVVSRQPAQGRRHERRRARRGPRRARLGPPGRGRGARPYAAPEPPRPRRDRRRAPRGARGDRGRGPGLHALPAPRDADDGRPGRGRPRHRGRLRRRGPGLQRGPPGPAVRRARRRPARQAPRLDRLAARGRLHHERRQVPAARTTATRSPTRSPPARRTCSASSRSSTRRSS